MSKIARHSHSHRSIANGRLARFRPVVGWVLFLAAELLHAETAYQVSTFAGVMPGSADGPGSVARFNSNGAGGIAADAAGAIYVADPGNRTIRRVSPSGIVTTVLGVPRHAGAYSPSSGSYLISDTVTSVAVDGSGDVYVAEFPDILRIAPDGSAMAFTPYSLSPQMVADAEGNIFVAKELTNEVWRLSPDGTSTKLAGSGQGYADGPGDEARFYFPSGIAMAPDGSVYVVDRFNFVIRKIDTQGVVSTIAGSPGGQGSVDGTGNAARFESPVGMGIDSDGNLYVGDIDTIRRITPGGTASTLAGKAGTPGFADGVGAAARFENITGVTVTGADEIYVFDNSALRKVSRDGIVTTFAGEAVDGSKDGSLAVARMRRPSGITLAANGDIYVTQLFDPVRKISSAGTVSTLPNADVVVGTSGRPTAVAVAADGTIYAANSYDHTISRRSSGGSPTLFAGTSGVSGNDDGMGAAATFAGPAGIALDAAGNLIVADGARIRKITPDGTVTTLAGSVVAGDGSVALDGQGTEATFHGATDVAIDAAGNIWVADSIKVRKITPGGLVTTIAGADRFQDYAVDGTGAAAQFAGITGIAVAPTGELYVADALDDTIRQVTPAGIVTTIAGQHRQQGAVDGRGNAARFDSPQDVDVDASGAIFVADQNNYAIRAIISGTPPVFDAHPHTAAVSAGGNVTLTAHANVSGANYRWELNGNMIAGQTGPALEITDVQPEDAGQYRAMAASGPIESASDTAIIGIVTSSKVTGAGTEVQKNVLHPNGNIFDQILLTGVAETITADPGQITRTSYIDLDDNIVQVEFSGAGSLSLVLSASSGPAKPTSYKQDVDYMKGHAGIVVVGANETTNLSVFTVGRATAFDPTGRYDITKSVSDTNDPANNGSPLFDGTEPSAFAGYAKIAFIAIASTDGKFGGLRAANAKFQGWGGLTGVYAPGVEFTGPVYVGDITAYDEATPVIITGSVSDARVTGGNLFQDNAHAVQVGGLTQLKFTAGSSSAGTIRPAQANQAVLERDGVDVTAQVVVNP
jgi:sugar lactone lactonase YvrE